MNEQQFMKKFAVGGSEPMTDQQLAGWRWLCEHASPQKSLDRATVGELASLLARLDAAEARIAQAPPREPTPAMLRADPNGANTWRVMYDAAPKHDAIAQARKEAYEEAAKVCENLVIEHVGNSALTLDQAAEALRERAAKEKP